MKTLDNLHDRIANIPTPKVKSEDNIFAHNSFTLFLLLVPALILFFVPFLLRPTIFSGDEPHYLMVANGLLKNHTLEQREVYEQNAHGINMAGKLFHGVNLEHHTAIIDPNKLMRRTLGQWHQFYSEQYRITWNLPVPPLPPENYEEYSVRAVGWPLVIAGVSYLTGVDAELVSKILSHGFVLVIATFVAFSLIKLNCSKEAAIVGGTAIYLGSSYWVFANTAFAESGLGACVAVAIYSIITRNGIMLGISLALGAWFKSQFLAASVILFLLGLVTTNGKERCRLTIAWGLGFLGCILLNIYCYGQIKPPVNWVSGNPIQAFQYFFINTSSSILLRNLWILGLAGILCIKRRKELLTVSIMLLFILFIMIAPPLCWGDYSGGFGYPCRLIQTIMIPLAIFFGILVDKSAYFIKYVSLVLLTASIFINFIAAISDPRLTWGPTWIWMQVFWNHLS